MRVEPFPHVRWIGGGSGAGKSTVAQILADQFDLTVYSTDDAIGRHTARLGAASPLLTQFLAMSMDERWLTREPKVMLDTFPWFANETFESVLDDLSEPSTPSPILAEGFRLSPGLVAPVLGEPWQAVWLIPTEDFRRAAFTQRPPSRQFWQRTSDPARALEQLLQRDALFTTRVRDEARALGLTVVAVDGSRGAEELATDLADRFRLAH